MVRFYPSITTPVAGGLDFPNVWNHHEDMMGNLSDFVILERDQIPPQTFSRWVEIQVGSSDPDGSVSSLGTSHLSAGKHNLVSSMWSRLN